MSDVRGTLPEGRTARKRRAIIEAAREMFLTRGYRGAGMDQIAAKAAVSKQTLYKQFTDKETLFTTIVLDTTGQIDSRFRHVTQTFGDSKDIESDLTELARLLIAALLDTDVLRLRRLVIAEAEHFPDLGRSYFAQGFQRGLDTLATGFRKLTDRGLLHIDDPNTAAEHFAGLALWIPMNQAMFCPATPTLASEETSERASKAVHTFLAAYHRPPLQPTTHNS